MKRTLSMLALATLIASAPAFAQQSSTLTRPSAQSTETPKEGSVNDRREDQQQRIGNGVQSGQLTAGETKNLESREANVNREIHADRSANGGKLTPQERRQVNRQQNNMSRSIYADKHNANTGALRQQRSGPAPRESAGPHRQRHRNGSMSAGEVARTENREQGINEQIHADRPANGGKLTGQEHRQINREQNRTSRQIYRQKHNAHNAPK